MCVCVFNECVWGGLSLQTHGFTTPSTLIAYHFRCNCSIAQYLINHSSVYVNANACKGNRFFFLNFIFYICGRVTVSLLIACVFQVCIIWGRWIFNLNFCRAGIALCWKDDDDDAFVMCFAGERTGVV